MGQDLGKQMGSLLKMNNLKKFSNPNAVFKSVKRGDWGLPDMPAAPVEKPYGSGPVYTDQSQQSGQNPQILSRRKGAQTMLNNQEFNAPISQRQSLAQALLSEKNFRG